MDHKYKFTVTSRDDFKDARGEENLIGHLFQKKFWVEAFFEMFSLCKFYIWNILETHHKTENR